MCRLPLAFNCQPLLHAYKSKYSYQQTPKSSPIKPKDSYLWMASLVLLLSEILWHEKVDNLMPLPASPSSASAPPSSATKRAAGEPATSLPSRCKSYAEAKFQEDLPRVCIDLTWPWIFPFYIQFCVISFLRFLRGITSIKLLIYHSELTLLIILPLVQ